MLKFQANKGKLMELEAIGDVKELITDVGMLLWSLHDHMLESNKECADMYKTLLQQAVKDEAVFADGLFSKKKLEKNAKDDVISKIAEEFENGEISDEKVSKIVDAIIKAVEEE